MSTRETVRVEREMIGLEDQPLVLRALYLSLLNPEGVHFQEGWSEEGLVGQATTLLRRHVNSWNSHDENQESPAVVLSPRADNFGWLSVEKRASLEQTSEDAKSLEVEESKESEISLEQNEFIVLDALWQWAHDSVHQNLSDAEFFEQGDKIVRASKLFESLQELEVFRKDGTVKNVWEHVEDVTKRSTSNFSLNDFGDYTSAQRKAEQRFVAITHDIANVLFADADFLQFHAHASAELLYSYRRWKGDDHAEAARIARVVDLHHILELIQLEGGAFNPNRVLTPQEVVRAFAKMENGWEIFGRLMLFCLVDVGERELFKAEHVTAALAMVDILVRETDAAITDEIKQRNALRAVKTATKFVQEMTAKYERTTMSTQQEVVVPNGLPQVLEMIQNQLVMLREVLFSWNILSASSSIPLEESPPNTR